MTPCHIVFKYFFMEKKKLKIRMALGPVGLAHKKMGGPRVDPYLIWAKKSNSGGFKLGQRITAHFAMFT